MGTRAIAAAATFVVLFTSSMASAQFSALGSFVCPVDQIGQPCNGESGGLAMCVPAECEVTVDRVNEAGIDANVPIACVECGACAAYGKISDYCSDTVDCVPPLHCFSGGFVGMGSGPPDNPDQYTVLYKSTWCAPWLNDAGRGPYDPPLLTDSPPWRPCSGGGTVLSTGTGGTGLNPDYDSGSTPSPELDAGDGPAPSSNGNANVEGDDGNAASAEAGSENPSDESAFAGLTGAGTGNAPVTRPTYFIGGSACSLATGPSNGGGLFVAGLAAALRVLRRSKSGARSLVEDRAC